MSILYNIFGTILKFIYDIVGNFGWSIVLLALFGKLLMLPLTIKQQKSMQMMQAVQPEITKVQEKYKNNQQRQGEELWKIYEKYNYNPMSSCLPILLQFPFIIGLFGVVREPATYVFHQTGMANIDMSFLWIPDLTKSTIEIVRAAGFGVQTFTAMILPILIVLLMYIQQKQTPKPQGQQAGMMGSMNSVMMVVMGYMSITFTSAIAVYWAAQTGIGVAQTALMKKIVPTGLEATVVEEKPERIEEPWEQGTKKKKKKKKK